MNTYKIDLVLDLDEPDLFEAEKLLKRWILAYLVTNEKIRYLKVHDLIDNPDWIPGQDDELYLKNFFKL